ncbi:MAG: FixH family protein [Steroidobacteraceae bacterium]|jgi:hypothetical protein|nr:FixH family protein [Steroidobacteraceae bacterium]
MQADAILSPAVAPPEAAGGRTFANPVVWVAIGVPLFAVVASILLVFVSVRRAEPELPANYSWEGAALEQDLARAGRAAALGATLGLEFAADGRLRARLAFRDAAQPRPARLVVHLTHSTLPALDRRFELALDAATGAYVAALPPLQRGHWLIEVGDGEVGGWRLRERFLAPATHVGLGL